MSESNDMDDYASDEELQPTGQKRRHCTYESADEDAHGKPIENEDDTTPTNDAAAVKDSMPPPPSKKGHYYTPEELNGFDTQTKEILLLQLRRDILLMEGRSCTTSATSMPGESPRLSFTQPSSTQSDPSTQFIGAIGGDKNPWVEAMKSPILSKKIHVSYIVLWEEIKIDFTNAC